jgi:hypothetical protein
MMQEADKLFQLRKEIMNSSLFDNSITEESILETILPELEMAKIIETPEISYAYFFQDELKINGYDINSTGERLLIYIINSASTDINQTAEDITVSSKEVYDNVFKMANSFLQKSIKRHIIPPSDKVGVLISQLQKNEFINDIDVVEIIQLSLTVTIDSRGKTNSLRFIDFQDEKLKVNYTIDNKQNSKEIIIKRKLIDLNHLKDIVVDKSSYTKLIVDFEKYNNGVGLKAIEAVKTDNFTSYLAVIPAKIISDLYKNESTKLLENNVRSFLSFKKDANSGMQKTIKSDPEKFIAFNNGLTITATEAEVETNNGQLLIKKLSDFQIVNGGQTTATIYFTQKENVDISKVFLMAKINVLKVSNENKEIEQEKLLKFVADISLYSNTQSKVDSVDFTSRSEEVKQIKRLSTNINPPTKDRWFFELMKGEFTTMVAFEKNETKKKRIREIYPKNRILEIKNLGKFVGAWGDIPFLVKLGGVKFNGIFLNSLKKIGTKNLDRTFYEDAIAKCILWDSFYNIYGAGKNSIGQLRASTVPYSIAAIYIHTDGSSDKHKFNFTKIWIEQKISANFELWAKELMTLMNELIQKYKISDNVEDGTKRKEVWDRIKDSKELASFFILPNAKIVLNEYKKTETRKKPIKEIDFSILFLKAEILTKGNDFYKYLCNKVIPKIEPSILGKVQRISDRLFSKKGEIWIPKDINHDDALFLKDLIIRLNNNFNIDEKLIESNNDLLFSVEKVIEIYNNSLTESKDIASEFDKLSKLAEIRKIQFAPSALRKIGATLKQGQPPNINDIFYAANYFNEKKIFTNIKTESHSESPSLITNKKNLLYIKKIISQDLERTPTFSIEAIRDFFNIELTHGESTVIKIQNLSSQNIFEIEFKLRETRGEYRIFLKDLFKEISPKEKDILIFRKIKNNIFTCEHIPNNSIEYNTFCTYFDENKNHKLALI